MNILITGASGFIASHIVTELLFQGHQVTCGVRDVGYAQRIFPNAKIIGCDFFKDQSSAVWLERLKDIEIVINCVGILYHPTPERVWDIHYHTPKVLFDTCVQAGVKKVIQISALGIDKVEVAYAQSKRAMDEYLLSLPITAIILRPSLVYGKGSYGGSSLFRGLAALPVILPVPGKGTQQLQPIHVEDLSKAVIAFVNSESQASKLLCAVGPQKIELGDILASIRAWLGISPAKKYHVPIWMIRLGSKLGDLIPYSGMNSTSLELLLQNNLATEQQAQRFQNEIGFRPLDFIQGQFIKPSTVQDHWHARLFFLKPLLRLSIAFIWLFTAICSLFLYSKNSSYQLLTHMGISGRMQPFVFYSAAVLDAGLGLAMLFNFKLSKVIVLQFCLLLVYTALITWKLPFMWLDPFGPVAKNIPLLAATLVYWAMESKR